MSLKAMPKPGFLINPLHPLSRNLKGWWLFNEGGGTRVNNYAPLHINLTGTNDFAGTLTDVDPVDAWRDGGIYGGGLFLNGASERVVLHTDTSGTDLILNASEPVSVSWWERANATVGANVNRVRFLFNIIGTSDRFISFRSSNATSYSAVVWGKAPGTLESIRAVDAPSINSSVSIWNHFVITSQTPQNTDPTLTRIWVNGIEYATTQGGSIATVGVENSIGRDSATVEAYMSDVRLYNRTLDEHDVRELFYNPFGNVLTNKLPKFVQTLAATAPDMRTSRRIRKRRLLYSRH